MYCLIYFTAGMFSIAFMINAETFIISCRNVELAGHNGVMDRVNSWKHLNHSLLFPIVDNVYIGEKGWFCHL